MRFSRTRLLVGEEGLGRLRQATVAVIGLGGVGSFAFEALVRAGVGRLVVIDGDCVESSNINRQLLALDSTVGRPKVEVAKERAAQINPYAVITPIQQCLTPDNLDAVLPNHLDAAIDAIDSLDAKVHLIMTLRKRNTHFVSCMGAALRRHATRVRVDDISRTKGCPLARAVRRRLRSRGIASGVPCVFSVEQPEPRRETGSAHPPAVSGERRDLGSLSYVPGIIGLTAAGLVINDLVSMA